MRSRQSFWKVWKLLLAVGLIALFSSFVVRETQKVNSPDILSLQCSRTLPGRPITGERLILPDGTMSLGYYGSIPVAGLTPHEIRSVVASQLRRWVPDLTPSDVAVTVAFFNARRSRLIDWVTGKIRLKDVRSLF
jgi:hypothetical protein